MRLRAIPFRPVWALVPSHVLGAAVACAMTTGCSEDDWDDCSDLVLSASDSTAAPSSGGSPAGDPGAPPCRTDVAAHLDQVRVPGLSAGLIRDGRLLCTSVAGYANLETREPVAPHTVFAWASVSKTVTATALMMLQEEQGFDLDEDVDDYLPFSTRNPHCPSEAITFRHLLTHTSSMYDTDIVYDTYVPGDSPIALGDFVQGYVTPGGEFFHPRNFLRQCPGTTWEYSNAAVGLVGYLVEVLSGTPFDDFCRERIFEPLEMTQTSFRLAPLDEHGIAVPYDRIPDRGTQPLVHYGYPTVADGLLRTSVLHMARFLATIAGGGESGGVRILSEESTGEMTRVQFPELEGTQALIWYTDFDGVMGHDGGDCGVSAYMFYEPATAAGALLVANGDWWGEDDEAPETDALFRALLDEARGD